MPAMTKPRRSRQKDAAPKPEQESGAGAKQEAVKTSVTRVPEDIGEMLETIAQHELNGWKTASAIIHADECPLRAWLIPLYEQVIREKQQRAAKIKGQPEEE